MGEFQVRHARVFGEDLVAIPERGDRAVAKDDAGIFQDLVAGCDRQQKTRRNDQIGRLGIPQGERIGVKVQASVDYTGVVELAA